MGKLYYPLVAPLDCFYLFHFFSGKVVIWFNASFGQFLFGLLAELPGMKGYGHRSVDDFCEFLLENYCNNEELVFF